MTYLLDHEAVINLPNEDELQPILLEHETPTQIKTSRDWSPRSQSSGWYNKWGWIITNLLDHGAKVHQLNDSELLLIF